MEQEQILTTLTEQLGQTSLSPRTLSDYVSENLPAEGQEFDYDKHVKILKSLNGNFSHSVAEEVTRQVSEFKKNYRPAEPPKPAETPKEDDASKALLERIAALEDKLGKRDSAEKQQSILAKVRTELKKKGADDAYVLDKTLQGVTFDADKSLDDTVREMLGRYDKEYTACRGKGAAPRSGDNGSGKGKTAADDFFARKAKKERWNK
ncbi:MAG: hypothetical protein NC311_07645 [Muribaculaceae bacterium]|nr:hypothetical protein [Muribaculaceae bacterium]